MMILVRNHNWPEKMFGLVTGFLEKEETPEEGTMREVKEELGLTTESIHFIGHYTFYEMNQIILAYHVKTAKGEIELGSELAGYKEIPPEKLKPWPFGTGKAVADWIERRRGDGKNS